MPIDRELLLEKILFWLPVDSNVLTDEEIMMLAESIILQVGDDEKYFAEVLCKTLYAVAIANEARQSMVNAGIKRERVGRVSEIEYFGGVNASFWKDYIQNKLPHICPLFGYRAPSTPGIKINPGKKIRIPACRPCKSKGKL